VDKFVRYTKQDSLMILADVAGFSLRHFPDFFEAGKPESLTYKGSKVLAKRFGIQVVKVETSESICNRDSIPKPVTTAVIRVKLGDLTRAGAGISSDEIHRDLIAKGIAFRNSVRQILTVHQKMSIMEVRR